MLLKYNYLNLFTIKELLKIIYDYLFLKII